MISITLFFIIMSVIAPGIFLLIVGIRKGDKQRAAVIIAVLIVTLITLGGGIKIFYDYNHTIGTFSGSEYDIITIDGVTYKTDSSNTYSGSDKKKLLGKVIFSGQSTNDTDPMYVWSIDGTDEYIYAVWVYDGQIFKKV